MLFFLCPYWSSLNLLDGSNHTEANIVWMMRLDCVGWMWAWLYTRFQEAEKHCLRSLSLMLITMLYSLHAKPINFWSEKLWNLDHWFYLNVFYDVRSNEIMLSKKVNSVLYILSSLQVCVKWEDIDTFLLYLTWSIEY